MARPKKKKIIAVIIIILTIVEANLANDITDSAEEICHTMLNHGMCIFDEDAEGDYWDSAQEAVYDAMEAIADAYAPEALGEPDVEALTANLANALDEL